MTAVADLAARLNSLGPEPSQQQVSRILANSLQDADWVSRPRFATAVLRSLHPKVPEVASQILKCMSASTVEVNRYHLGAAVSVCEKASQWHLALHLYESMAEGLHDQIIWNSAISSCSKRGLWQRTLCLLTLPGFQADVVTYGSSIPGASTFASAAHGGDLGSRLWHLTLTLLAAMAGRAILPNVFACSSSISSMRGMSWSWAFQMMSRMRKLDIRGNPTVYGASIRAAEEAEGWSISLTALASMGQEVERNVISENAAISSCMRAFHWTDCLACLKDMQTCQKRSPTSVSYATVMAAVSSISWQAPLGLFTHLRTLRAVDAVATSTAVRACCEHAAWAVAMDIVKRSNSINEVSYHIVLESFSGTCNWEQAIELLCCMRAARFRISAAPCAAAMRGCGLGGQWQMVLSLLDELLSFKALLDETTLSCAMDASARSGNWELALHFFCEQGSGRQLCDPVTYTAAIAACLRGSQWQLALELVRDFESLKLVPDTILFNTAISAAQTGTQWEAALSELQRMQTLVARADSVSHNTAISGCERVSLWQRAVDVCREIQKRSLRFSEVGHNAVTSSLEKSSKWQSVLQRTEEEQTILLNFLPSQIGIDTAASAIQKSSHWHLAIEQIARTFRFHLSPDALAYSAAISACEKSCRWKVVQELLTETTTVVGRVVSQLRSEGRSDACDALHLSALERSEVSWRMAKLSRAGESEMAPLLALTRPKPDSTLADISNWIWSAASVGLDDTAVEGVVEMAKSKIEIGQAATLSLRMLANLAWGLASLDVDAARIFLVLQGDLNRRGRVLTQNAPREVLVQFVSVVAEVLWACHLAGALSSRFLATSLAEPVLTACKRLDAMAAVMPAAMAFTEIDIEAEGHQPRLLEDLSDRLVLYKPAGWQVDDQMTSEGRPLSGFLRSAIPIQRQVLLNDLYHQRGFLHRLDVPSSGLILAATSYSGYYDLRLQLSMGMISREYTALCHGFIGNRRITAPVFWLRGLANASVVRPEGRPALSNVRRVSSTFRLCQGFSLVQIVIFTGRRHQIRLHTAYIGHPTVSDSKYGASITFEEDVVWCSRNFLHRHRLSFKEAVLCAEQEHSVVEPLPQDLKLSLLRTKPSGRTEREIREFSTAF
ncbi:unnamed protein product [Symbiodinium necroappetens]|uniref:Pseudouridine synthase RsuA/RluA-like domain-containing protein n=1 Tax=Symbiodinium necroappetens TaxID=1628268 RepID=A0A812P0U5_9DINO|nr:unnamed protein product [Symbiodinium necroappetens]